MRRITRRDALKLAALASTTATPLAPLSGCTDVPRMTDTNATAGTRVTPAVGAHAIEGADAVLGLTPLEFQWPTRDPFLFCVHHDDAYPAGNEQMGPVVSLAGRALGQDFTVKDGFRMYHGEVVPGFPQHPHRGFETVTVVRRGLLVTLQNGDTPSELLLLQGRPIGEPTVKHGPFVMNTMDEIRQAYADYQQTGFGGWPYSSSDPVHPREEGRFARHADGRIERPA